MIQLRFLRRAGAALVLGFTLAFGSSAGQTYFVSLFAGEWRAEIGLSHGEFGSLYTLATLASGITLLWLGRLADRFDLVRLSAAMLACLATAALLTARLESKLGLGVALFGLRLFGQGMMSHLAITAMGRWFIAERGRAVSVATLGFPVGEAMLPAIVAVLLRAFSWRQVWMGVAFSLAMVAIPLVLWVGHEVRRRGLDRPAPLPAVDGEAVTESWTRRQVLHDRRFYALLPGVLVPPFMITGILFHQVHLVATKGWTLTGFAACYPFYAASATLMALGLGAVVDRCGAVRLLPFYLLPLAAGLALLGMSDRALVAPFFMLLMGCTAGGATIVFGALWPELYGTAHLGDIRALTVALVVLATALSPGLLGWFVDRGVNLNIQAMVMSGCAFICAVGFTIGLPWLRGRPALPPASVMQRAG